MFHCSDDELLRCVKDFCYYLFETAEIDKSLSYCTDNITYYNSMGAVDIVGKETLKNYFYSRQKSLAATHKVIFHKYTVQRISIEYAVVHLMAELQGKFWVNSSITLTKKNNMLLICNIQGFITELDDEQNSLKIKSQHDFLQFFSTQIGEWQEDNKNLLARWGYNLTQDSVHIIYVRSEFKNTFSNPIPLHIFLEKIKRFIATEEAKKELALIYDKKSLLHRFMQGDLKFKTVFPFLNQGKFLWTRSYNTLFEAPETNDIWCFEAMYDVSEELIKNTYSDHHLYSQIDFFVQLNTQSNTYSLFPEKRVEPILGMIPFSGKFNNDFELLLNGYVHEDDIEKVRHEFNCERIFENIRQYNFYSFICRIKRSGDSKNIRYKQIQFFKFSQVPYIINIACSDITDMYAAEMQKNEVLSQALEAATTANHAKNSFLASMSHDLRTPMNAILGMTQLAMEDLDNKEQVAESFQIIKQSSEHLLNLLNDILELNKIENGSSEKTHEPFSLMEESNKVLAFYQSEILTRQHLVTTDFSQIKHDIVLGDKTKFSRIFSNIVGNAIKYTPDGGKIDISIFEKSGKQSALVGYYTLRIQDTGIGIAAQNIPYIFNPFHREENGKIRKIQGLGLGLSIVKAFVDNLGGSISVESELGHGATFTVELPYQLNESCLIKENQQEFTTNNIHLQNMSVLLAEDNSVNILMFKKILEKCGARVTVAQNGKKAYDAVLNMDASDPFRIIFMDLQMPVMDGYEAAQKIRNLSDKKIREIPIVAVTANAYQEDIKKTRDAGMNAHIAKPIKLFELFEVLKEIGIIA